MIGGRSCIHRIIVPATGMLLVAASSLLPAASRDETRMLDLINAERKSRGLISFSWNESLARLARQHARDMKRMGKATHRSSADGVGFSGRLARSGMKVQAAAENVAYDRNVESAHRGLMRSPGHRANLLDALLTAIGIGVVEDDDGTSVYVVQDFATPMVDLSDDAALDAVRHSLISAHGQSGGGVIEEDAALSGRMLHRLEGLISSDTVEIPGDLVGGPAWVIAYTTMNPAVLPPEARERTGGARTFGLAVVFRKTPSYEFGIYWVLMALVRP